LSELTEGQERAVVAIVKDVIRAELKDSDSTLRLVLDRSLDALEDRIVKRLTELVAPVIVKSEKALSLQQDPKAPTPWTFSMVIDQIIRAGTAGGLLYVFFKYLQTH